MECLKMTELKNEIMTNSERLMRYANEKTNPVELAEIIKNVGEHVNKLENNKSTKEIEAEKKVKENNDFYSRLKNIYNKPLTAKARDEEVVSRISESIFPRKSIELSKDGSRQSMKNSYDNCSGLRSRKRINFSKLINEEIFCKDLVDEVKPPDFVDGRRRSEEEKDFVRCKVPSLSHLPDDEEELEELLRSYIDDMKPKWRRHRSGKPYPPGSKESVRSIEYRLANLKGGKEAEQAAVGRELLCACPEEVLIEGEQDSIKDISSKLLELKKNHRISRVTIRMKKARKSVKENIDTKTKIQDYREGPALLTKYCMEKVCQGVAKHPKLTTLAVEGVPLSPNYQAILVPSFATLRELKLISNKLGDDGVRTICRYAWRSGSLRVLDLSSNEIGPAGVRELVALLERRAVLRMMEAEFFGVERISLNRNPIKYDGFQDLLNAAGKDLWTKALDLRDCQLSRGGEEALRLVRNNKQIQVLDLRGNPLEAVGQIVRTVLSNCPPEHAEYSWHDQEDLHNYLHGTTNSDI